MAKRKQKIKIQIAKHRFIVDEFVTFRVEPGFLGDALVIFKNKYGEVSSMGEKRFFEMFEIVKNSNDTTKKETKVNKRKTAISRTDSNIRVTYITDEDIKGPGVVVFRNENGGEADVMMAKRFFELFKTDD